MTDYEHRHPDRLQRNIEPGVRQPRLLSAPATRHQRRDGAATINASAASTAGRVTTA
jgi:hypothetical protein